MFNHILVPIDGSETSMLAVSKASGLALAFGSRITLIHVVDNYPFIGVGADYALGQNEYLAAATSSANAALARGVAALAAEGLHSDQRVIDDARVIHESTPIQPLDDSQPGWRDTLVVTCRAGAFQGD